MAVAAQAIASRFARDEGLKEDGGREERTLGKLASSSHPAFGGTVTTRDASHSRAGSIA